VQRFDGPDVPSTSSLTRLAAASSFSSAAALLTFAIVAPAIVLSLLAAFLLHLSSVFLSLLSLLSLLTLLLPPLLSLLLVFLSLLTALLLALLTLSLTLLSLPFVLLSLASLPLPLVLALLAPLHLAFRPALLPLLPAFAPQLGWSRRCNGVCPRWAKNRPRLRCLRGRRHVLESPRSLPPVGGRATPARTWRPLDRSRTSAAGVVVVVVASDPPPAMVMVVDFLVVIVVENRVERPRSERTDQDTAAEHDPGVDSAARRLRLRLRRNLGIIRRHVHDVGARGLDANVLLRRRPDRLILVRFQVAGVHDQAPVVLDCVQDVPLLVGHRLSHLVGPRRILVEPAQNVGELQETDDTPVPAAVLGDRLDALRLPRVRRRIVDLLGICRRRQQGGEDDVRIESDGGNQLPQLFLAQLLGWLRGQGRRRHARRRFDRRRRGGGRLIALRAAASDEGGGERHEDDSCHQTSPGCRSHQSHPVSVEMARESRRTLRQRPPAALEPWRVVR
jgi:hypothetical protein